MNTINIVGCGNVGKTLGRLWTEHGVLEVRSVLNRSPASSRRAVRFIGSGQAVARYSQMERADLVMISTSDEAIEACSDELCRAERLRPGTIVFHLSGSLPSAVLKAAKNGGASIASVHPVMSFADPAAAVRSFAGTFCAVEGDAKACEVLCDAFGPLGARTFQVEAEFKTVYHAATVMSSNYLIALIEAALQCFEKAGVPRGTGLAIIEPIVRGTTDNLFSLGPVRALTGPIARGEASVVAAECEALGRWDENVQTVYRALGRVALELSAAQDRASPDSLAAMKELFG